MNKIIFILTCLFAGSANAIPTLTEHITNGGFETGDFTGWNVVNTGNGAWNINDGTLPTFFGTQPPISGGFDAVTTQSGPGFHSLSQNITLSNISSAILSWDDRIQSNAAFVDPNQEWRVIVEDLVGNLIGEVFSTNAGDTNPQLGPNSRSFDITSLLSPFANQTISISFQQQDNLGFFSATLDNVSFTTASVPEPSIIALLGIGLAGIGFSRRKKNI